MQFVYWPYDEVTLVQGDSHDEILISTPWLQTSVSLCPDDIDRAIQLVEQFKMGTIGTEHLRDLNWFFAPLAKYPLSYILPRQTWQHAGLEVFEAKDKELKELQPASFLAAAADSGEHAADVSLIANSVLFEGDWKWDAEGALKFSETSSGFDPYTLFSVARRYHLLSSVESNGTKELYDFVKGQKADSEKYKSAAALMVRQNHYVTEQCHAALSDALPEAKGARQHVKEFIDAEYGHDRILNIAMKTIVRDPQSVPVMPAVKLLMDLLAFAGKRNFLAFAMIVDFLERSAYQESDPLASMLEEGGLTAAAKQINRHMDINDAGEHENVALSFLETMGPISSDYGTEALRLAEATTNVMNLIAANVYDQLDHT